jgi:hypothetical protein
MALQVDPIVLRENNPYSLSNIILLPDDSVVLEAKDLVYTKSDRDRYFTTIQGDSLWAIAGEAYGDSKYWWLIAKVNNIDEPFEVEPGLTLLIPDLVTFQLNN